MPPSPTGLPFGTQMFWKGSQAQPVVHGQGCRSPIGRVETQAASDSDAAITKGRISRDIAASEAGFTGERTGSGPTTKKTWDESEIGEAVQEAAPSGARGKADRDGRGSADNARPEQHDGPRADRDAGNTVEHARQVVPVLDEPVGLGDLQLAGGRRRLDVERGE